MLDLFAFLFVVLLTARAVRAARNRLWLVPAGSWGTLEGVLRIQLERSADGSGPQEPDGQFSQPLVVSPGDVLAVVTQRQAAWLLFAAADAELSPGLVSAALETAEAREADAISIRGHDPTRSRVLEGLSITIAQWTGDGVDPIEFGGADDRRAVGFDDFFLVRRAAYVRVGGHASTGDDPCRTRALVRGLKRAGKSVLIASAPTGLVIADRSLSERIQEGVDRFQSLAPPGRVWPLLIAGLVTICGLRPFTVVVRGVLGSSTPPSTFALGLALVSCGGLLVHRAAFHALTGTSRRSAWTLPIALLAVSAAAWVATLQRLAGRGSRWEALRKDPGPDHSAGVDYRAVYTERYFDGVDSRFSPCGFRDDPRYYDRLLEPLLRHRRTGRALDVGCGYGYLTRRLSQHFETQGIDVSEAAVRHCREALPHLEFAVHEVEQPFPMVAGSFDVVTLTDVLEHLVDPERMLRNVHRVLAAGGLLYVTTPNLNRIRRWLYADADRREHHVSLMPRTELVRLLERNGFRVVRSWTYVSAYLLPGRFRSDIGPETGVICEKAEAG